MESQWRCIHTIGDIEIGSGRHTIRFSPDGKTLSLGYLNGKIATYNTSQMWDVSSGELKKTGLENKEGVLSLDGKTLVACDSEGQTIQLWDVETGELTKSFTLNSSKITFTDLSPDSRTVVTCDAEENLKLWNVTTGEQTYNLGQFPNALSVIFSPNGQIIGLHSSDKFAYFWNVNTGARMGGLYNKAVDSIAFTSDNKALSIAQNAKTFCKEVASSGGSDSYYITSYYPEIWDAISGQKIGSFEGECVGLSPDGQIGIGSEQTRGVGEINKSIRVKNLKGGPTIPPISEGTHAAFSPLGNILAVVEEYGQSLNLLNWPDGAKIATIPGWIGAFAFSLDEKALAIVSNNSIKLWQTSTKPLIEQRLHGNAYPQLQTLENLLATERWEDADDEMTAILKDDPTLNLTIVDELWVHYSKGHYGFSVQDEILKHIKQNPHSKWDMNGCPLDDSEEWQRRLGWSKVGIIPGYLGHKDQCLEQAWNKTYKGYYPRKSRRQLWNMSRQKG